MSALSGLVIKPEFKIDGGYVFQGQIVRLADNRVCQIDMIFDCIYTKNHKKICRVIYVKDEKGIRNQISENDIKQCLVQGEWQSHQFKLKAEKQSVFRKMFPNIFKAWS